MLGIGDVLQKYPVFFLKGDPGSGKTTLLRHLALAFATGSASSKLDWPTEQKQLVPILVPLRDFGLFLAQNKGQYTLGAKALRDFVRQYFENKDLPPMPSNFFRQLLDAGDCLILLDGFDEVANRGLRQTVAQYVHQFIETYSAKGNHIGLTSRPKGYESVAAFLPEAILCDVLPLEPEQRNQLIYNLFRELATAPAEAERNTNALLQDLARKPRVETLSRNPLFCTSLVLVYRYVYSYTGGTLPERRVDLYQELVNLRLSYWDLRKEVQEAHKLVQDVRGRLDLLPQNIAQDHSQTLEAVAYWMVTNEDKLQDREVVARALVEAQVSERYATRFEANEQDKTVWARRFLDLTHERSGLFIDIGGEQCKFAHKNFLEYFAATALVGKRDEELKEMILSHAGQDWWEEVLLLALAHGDLSEGRREFLFTALLEAGEILLAGQAAVDARERVLLPQRRKIRDLLYTCMTDMDEDIQRRAKAGEILDQLTVDAYGTRYLPDDLNTWQLCEGVAEHGVYATPYLVTNAQFTLFMAAGGYTEPAYWGGEAHEAWLWRLEAHPEYRGKGEIVEPEYWRDVRFGEAKQGYPVVGVSWYEAWAYANWLTALLRRVRNGEAVPEPQKALVAGLIDAPVAQIVLPREAWWVALAGGTEPNGRYAWDAKGQATTEVAEMIKRANISEARLRSTTPVGMYPAGRSPHGLHDMSGNVWEWQQDYYDKDSHSGRVVRGGSWGGDQDGALVSGRSWFNPGNSFVNHGLRVVAPIVAHS